MQILLIGLGSIGARHLRNILSLGYTNVSVVSRGGILPTEFGHLVVFTSIEAALSASSFDTAIICTPTSVHIAALKLLLEAQVANIYVEKPLSHSLEDTDAIIKLAGRYSNNIVVGFDLRFDPGIAKVKELLDNKSVGKVVSVNSFVGQYLPDWRPQEDYRKGMSARKETGGGVLLDLVHEFDYLYSLFGKVEILAALYNNSKALDIETEDVGEVLLQFKSNILGTIHLDYLQPKLIRSCTITGYDGTIIWNLAAGSVTLIDRLKNVKEFAYKEFDRNDRFISIMKAFLTGGKDERLTSISEGLESLKMVLAAKKSSESLQFVSP